MTDLPTTADLPLTGITVLDFSQYLAGPVAAMRLADLGARVIKVERPGSGEAGRRLAFAGMEFDGDTMSFHAMNRGKESYAANLKDPADLAAVTELVRHADVLIQNFRPGVMERLGLDYETVRGFNPAIVYGSISGYGGAGPWRELPGQDLLAQSMSGLPWVNGDRDQGPVPVGVSVADLLGSCHLAQGITALLVRRARTGQGGLIESSLMEGLIDLQFELMSAHLNDRDVTVERGGPHSASAFMAAPFGIYETTDGFIAIAMNPVPRLGQLIGLPELTGFTDPDGWWHDRERINATLAAHLATRSTQDWLDVLRPADVWCAPVMTLPELVDHDGFGALDIDQPISRTGADGSRVTVHTTRSPLRIDGGTLVHERGAPHVGEHTAAIDAELGLRRNGQAER